MSDEDYKPHMVIVWGFGALVFWLILLGAFMVRAQAHDIYTTLKQPSGALCCGGSDCEPVDYKILSTGDAIFSPRKNVQGEVLVPKDKITWMQVPGGESFEAHWCGRRRTTTSAYGSNNDGATTADQPDPSFWTYCAFIAPGGV